MVATFVSAVGIIAGLINCAQYRLMWHGIEPRDAKSFLTSGTDSYAPLLFLVTILNNGLIKNNARQSTVDVSLFAISRVLRNGTEKAWKVHIHPTPIPITWHWLKNNSVTELVKRKRLVFETYARLSSMKDRNIIVVNSTNERKDEVATNSQRWRRNFFFVECQTVGYFWYSG